MAALIDTSQRAGRAGHAFACVLAVLAVVAAGFWPTGAAMVAVWNGSNTYSHGFFIVPAFVWLVWQRRETLARLPLRPTWWALPAVVLVGLAWLLGEWMALALPSQAAMVALVPAAIAGLLGAAWVRALAFPLAFLFFAVPFGDSLVPLLMDWTADFTVAALRLSGVPVYRDGLHFDIPSGKWSVVDSCSGIRYVFACLALSSLYAWTIYRGNTRRLAFIGLALVVAIVANWLRAYAIVMLGHLSDNRIAAGADHLVYGGVFFAFVMTVVFALGAAWQEPAATPQRTAARNAAQARGDVPAASPWPTPAALATLAALLIWPVSTALSSDPGPATSIAAAVDIAPRGGWVRVERPVASWQPVLNQPAAVASASFARDDELVGLHIGLFGRSTAASKLTSAANRLLEADGVNPHWKLLQQGTAEALWGGQAVELNTGSLLGSEMRLHAWQGYWVDDEVTADPLRAAALQLAARLRGRPELSAWITVYTRDGAVPGGAARLLQDFLTDNAASIDAALAAR